MPRHTSSLLAAVAVLAFASTPVFAADTEAPSLFEDIPEVVPVAVEKGFYLRGDVGYGFARTKYDFSLFGQGVSQDRIVGGFGAGYRFTEHFRVDVSANYLGRDRFSYNDGLNSASASHTVWSGLVTGYYDIATIMEITPYVGVGVGFTHSQHKLDINAPAVPLAANWSESRYDFAYALTAGASYKVSDKISVDFGYQFTHAPSMQYLDASLSASQKGFQHHQVKVGLRFDLW